MLKYSESPLSQLPYLELFQSVGGPVRAFFRGASLETFSGEAQLKKITLYLEQTLTFLEYKFSDYQGSQTMFFFFS